MRIPGFRNLIFTLLFVVALMAAAVFQFHENSWFDEAANLGEMITGIIAIVALVSFITEQKKRGNIAVLEQVSFFRKEILEDLEQIIQTIRVAKPDFLLPTLRANNLEEFSFIWLYENRNDALSAQTSLMPTEGPRVIELSAVIRLANKLEEFSLQLIHNEVVNHPATTSVQDSFVEMVECFAGSILSQKLGRPSYYGGIQSVYMQWKDRVSRESPETTMNRVRKEVELRIKEGKVKNFWEIVSKINEKRKK